MITANASEFVKAHTSWIWEAPDGAGERAIAEEAVHALFDLTRGWLDIVALEIRLGFYDHATLTEARARPPEAGHLLRLQSADGVRVKPMYRPLEERTTVLDAATVIAWIAGNLHHTQTTEERHEPSLRELIVAGSRARLPADSPDDQLKLDCYAGESLIPVDRGWVTAPSEPPGIPDPIAIRVANLDDSLRMILEVFWTPWAQDNGLAADITAGLSRLSNRGWTQDA